jgi:ribulose-phosphate 3-epimerase
MSRLLLAASLMCADQAALGDEVERLEAAGIDAFHIDIMDGHFVPNLAMSPAAIRAIRARTRLPIHAHLMIERPEGLLAELALAGADLAFVHLEATRYPIRLLRQVAELGIAPGLALNPTTPLPDARELLETPDLLVMAVEPGFAGGAWVPSSVDRVRRLRDLAPATSRIHVDGHVDGGTLPAMWDAGATGFVCGTSGLFTGAPDGYGDRLRALRGAVGDATTSAPVAAGREAGRA